MLQSPKLISVDLKAVLKDIHFLFELYCGFKIHETVKIFRGFPYIVNLQHRKITLFCGQFKKYRLTHKQIIDLCVKSGGLLGASVTNFKGTFDTMKAFGINSQDTQKVLDVLPEFILQNIKGSLAKKFYMIKEESGRDKLYMANFVKRHPDIMMK